MKPWKTYPQGKLYLGHCYRVMKKLPAGSVHLMMTSPPYWQLRDYQTATWVGGDANCDHIEQAQQRTRQNLAEWSAQHAKGGGKSVPTNIQYKQLCGKCGAQRVDEQIGMEEVPDCCRHQIPRGLQERHPELQPCGQCFVCHIVKVFRAVRHVLRDDGAAVLNLGDSYASGEIGRHDDKQAAGVCAGVAQKSGRDRVKIEGERQSNQISTGLRPKSLVGIPWRCAFALQADGWVLRSDVPWLRRTPMPESVTDRPAKSLEYVFVLTKNPRYYWDVAAVRQGSVTKMTHEEYEAALLASRNATDWYPRVTADADPKAGKRKHGKQVSAVHPDGRNFRQGDLWFASLAKPHGLVGIDDELVGLDVSTEPLRIKHFAAYPTKLVEPFVKACTSAKGCCPHCGANWVRQVEEVQLTRARPNKFTKRRGKKGTGNVVPNDMAGVEVRTIGWVPGCNCPDNNPIPCTVIDPFGGTGTSAVAAQRLGRNFIAIDLSEKYLAMADKRITTRGQYGRVGGRTEQPTKPKRLRGFFAGKT